MKIQLWCSRQNGGILCCYFQCMCILNFSFDGSHDVVAWNAPRNLLIIVHNLAPPHSLGNRLSWSSSRGKGLLGKKGSSRSSHLTAEGLFEDSVSEAANWFFLLLLRSGRLIHPWAHHSIHSCNLFGHSYTL